MLSSLSIFNELNNQKEVFISYILIIYIIKKESHNRNKPPSSDGVKKSKKASKRRKGAGKKPGGQKGHIGKTLEMVDTPDKIIVHEVSQCSNCGRSLKEEEATAYEKMGVFDIPPIKVEVT